MGTVTKNIVSGAFLYTTLESGSPVILIVNQGIHIETMGNSLLCPMQMRINDITLDECPKSLIETPTLDTHAMTGPLEDPSGVIIGPYTIPFNLRGVTSCISISKPTLQQYETLDRIELTSETLEWDPQVTHYAEAEAAMMDSFGNLKDPGDRNPHFFIKSISTSRQLIIKLQREASLYSQCSAVLTSIEPALDENHFGTMLKANRNISMASSSKRKGLSPEKLAKTWKIPLHQAKNTIKVTTQRGIRTIANPAISRRFKTNDRMLRYNRLPHTVFSDTLIAKIKSRTMNKYAQLYATDFGWSRGYPMKHKSDAHHTLSKVFKDVGVPDTLVTDGAKETIKGDFRRKAREADCRIRDTEPYTPWSNAAEGGIREAKKGAGRKMAATRTPKRLWDDCIQYQCLVRSHTALDNWNLHGQVPETVMTGQTVDISQFCELDWYEWMYFHDPNSGFPEDKWLLGRYCGPTLDVGPAMTAKCLKSNGQQVFRSTYRPLTQAEYDNPIIQQQMKEFDEAIAIKLGPCAKDSDFEFDFIPDAHTPTFDPYSDEDNKQDIVPDRDESQDFDAFIGAEVLMPHEDNQLMGKVRERKRERDGSLKGTGNTNALFDTRAYVIEFPDGAEAEYTANIIAQNMYAQCDKDGNQFILLKSITDHKTDGHAVEKADAYITVKGKKSRRKTTKGWSLCIEWKDGTTSWERLADLKESNPVEVAEYAVAMGIEDQPAFQWWVPYTLNKRDRIISAVNSRYHKRAHKFGFRVPKTVHEAMEIDKENGDDRWAKSVKKEMDAVRIAFEIKDSPDRPVGYERIGCHLIFDVKMEDFRFKARMVANGNETDTPAVLTYASVVSRESVRIALTLAALNELSVKTSDIQNAYLTAPTTEKLYTKLGVEFGADVGKIAIIVRALYGTKSAGAAFRNHLADCMIHLGYESCRADADVWMKQFSRPDGSQYYGYMLLYVDDALCINMDAEGELHRLDRYFKMKEGSIGDPDIYLGGKITQMLVEGPNGDSCLAWGISPTKYVSTAIENVEHYLKRNFDRKLQKRAGAPFASKYRPKLDISPELDNELASYYQSQIGILWWMVELGRIDNITEVSELAS